jgi:hypothetical protein
MKLFIIFLLCIISSTWAAELRPLKIMPQNQGVYFSNTGKLNPRQSVLVYRKSEDRYVLEGMLEIIGCKEKFCNAKVKKIKTNVVLNNQHIFSIVKLTAQIQRPQPTVANTSRAIYVGYGGPLQHGFLLSYMFKDRPHYSWGLSAGMFDQNIQNVGFSGFYSSLIMEYAIIKSQSGWHLSPYLEAGIFRGVVDFTQLGGPMVTHFGPVTVAGLAWGKEWESWSLLMSGGYSYNILQTSYTDIDDSNFTTPMAGGLITFKAALGWKF